MSKGKKSLLEKKPFGSCPIGTILKHVVYEDTWVVKTDDTHCITLGPCKSHWASNGVYVKGCTLEYNWYVVWEPENDK